MITLKEILDGSKDREMEIREEIKKIDELLKLLPTTNSNYDIWLNKRNDLEARLVKKESVKEAYARTPDEMAMKNYNKKYADLTPEEKKEVDIELGDLMQELGEACKKKEAYTIIKVDGADIPVEIDPEEQTAKDMKGNKYIKLQGAWRMESVTIMQGSPTDYKVGSRVRIVGGLYSNSFGKITAMNENEITVETEVDGKKVKVLPKQIVMAEVFTNIMEALKEGMSKYNPAKVVRKEGISKDTEDWIYQVYQKGATVDDIKDLLRIEKDIVMPLEGIRYIIQNYKESFKEAVVGQKILVGNFDSDYPAIVTGVDNGKVTTAQVKMYGVTKEIIIDNDKWWVASESLKEANPISDYDDKELNDKAMDLFGKGFQFLSNAERKQVLDSFKEVVKKEIMCNTCKQDAETVNGRPYCNTCQKFLDESLKEMANVNKIKLTGAWNIPKIVSKVQDLAVNYGTHFADGVIDTKGLLDKELNGLMGDLKGMGLTYTTESLDEEDEEDRENQEIAENESLKESTDREVEAKKLFGKAYKDLTEEEKKKVYEANIVSLALGIESLKEYAQYSDLPADLKNLDSKYYSDNKSEDELLKMVRADLPALSKYSDSEIKSAISIFRSD